MNSSIYDAIIVGGGPAGLSAAIYLARAKYSVLVIEKEKFGGQITITEEVVNYPGIFKTSGKELTKQMQEQAKRFGAEFLLADVTNMSLDKEIKEVVTSKGTYQSVGLVLATGSSPRKLGFAGEKEFQGRGVAYCATCDGEFFTGKQVFVIGGGFAAAEESIFLTKYASKVTMIIREEDFTCARTIADKVLETPNIEVFYNTEITEASGEGQLEYARFINNKSKEEWTFENKDGFGIFVFAGYVPANDLFKDKIELSNSGNIVVDTNQKTNIDGVYGAGDICQKDLRQVVTAVSDGAIAATSLEKYISNCKEEHDLQTKQANHVEDTKETDNVVTNKQDGSFISGEIQAQLTGLFAKLEKDVTIHCFINDNDFAKEMKSFVEEFGELSDHIIVNIENISNTSSVQVPTIALQDNTNTVSLQYHAIPGGHEFNSFVVAIYNLGASRQPLDEHVQSSIASIKTKKSIKVAISLSCTMCPEVVMASQRIAMENSHVTVDIYDIAHFPELKEQYKIMSVPCMIVDDQAVHFGKKSIEQIIDIIKD